jgi:hypothetical protein
MAPPEVINVTFEKVKWFTDPVFSGKSTKYVTFEGKNIHVEFTKGGKS